MRFELVDGEHAERHVVESEATVEVAPLPVEPDVDALCGRIFGRLR